MKWGWGLRPPFCFCFYIFIIQIKFFQGSISISPVFNNASFLKNLEDDHYSKIDPKVRVDVDSLLNEEGDDFDFPIHYASYVTNAVETGVKEATELFEKIEPALYKKSKLHTLACGFL